MENRGKDRIIINYTLLFSLITQSVNETHC